MTRPAQRPRSTFGRTELLGALLLSMVFGGGCLCVPKPPLPNASATVVGPDFAAVGEEVTIQARGHCYGPLELNGGHERLSDMGPVAKRVSGPDGREVVFQQDPDSGVDSINAVNAIRFVPAVAGRYRVEILCYGAFKEYSEGTQPKAGDSDHRSVEVTVAADSMPRISAGGWVEAWRPGVALRYDGAVLGSPSGSTALLWTANGCDGLTLTDGTTLRPTLTAAGATTCKHVDLTLQATSSTGRTAKDTTRLTFKAGLDAPTSAITLVGETFGAYQFVDGALDLTSPSRLTRYAVTLIGPDGAEQLVAKGAGTGAAATEQVHQPLRFQLGAAGSSQLRTEVVTAHGTLVALKAVAAEASAPGYVVSPMSGPTARDGRSATFTVRLARAPAGPVILTVASDAPELGTADPAALVFTPERWSTDQVVTVTGVLSETSRFTDATYAISLGVDPRSTDTSGYAGSDPPDVTVTHLGTDREALLVSAPSGSTTEGGGQATFTVRLGSRPASPVTLSVASKDLSEGVAAPAQLAFTQDDWQVPQLVTVTGVDDAAVDHAQPYAVEVAVAAGYPTAPPVLVNLLNADDDVAGYLVSAPSGPTTEAGGQATFTVRLTSQPNGLVVLGVVSSAPSEGTAAPATLTFDATSWATPQVVTVTGVDDPVDDGDRAYAIQLGYLATSTDGTGYASLTPGSVAFVNQDDDTAALVLTAASGPTSEAGGQATFTVRLATQPTGTVLLDVASTDATEGAAAPARLTFTAATWSAPQVVTVTGADDQAIDGPQAYAVRLAVSATSTDATGYKALATSTVALTNLDNDTPLYELSAASGPTTEAGGQATFTMRLGAQPNGLLIIDVASALPSEGTASPATLTFDAGNWATPQVVTVTGVDDAVVDGDQPYLVVLSVDPVSTDTTGLTAIDPPDVDLVNLDDDAAGYLVSAINDNTRETGTTATFTVRLTAAPTGTLLVDVASSDTSEGTVSTAQLSFTAADWSTPQTVTITGVDDALADGNVAYAILLTRAAASTAGGAYASLDPPDVSLLNIDDDGAGGEGRIGLFVQDYFKTVAIDGAVASVRGTPFQATSASLFLQGYAEIAKVPVGPQTVDVTYPGFGTVTLTGTVTAGGLANFGIAELMDTLPPGDLRVSLTYGPAGLWAAYGFTPAGEQVSSGNAVGTGLAVEGTAGRFNFRLTGATQLPGDYVFKTWDPTTGATACAAGLVFRIYDSTGLIQTLPAPTTGCNPDSFGWNALRVNGSTVTPINTFSNVEPTNGNY